MPCVKYGLLSCQIWLRIGWHRANQQKHKLGSNKMKSKTLGWINLSLKKCVIHLRKSVGASSSFLPEGTKNDIQQNTDKIMLIIFRVLLFKLVLQCMKQYQFQNPDTSN